MSSSRFRPFTVRRAPQRLKEAELPFGAGGPEASAITVSQFVARLNAALRTGFPDTWVKGELSQWKVWPSGHAYFSLKDESATLRARMWASELRRVPFTPKDGMEILARGAPDVYAPKGELSFRVLELQPYGVGALQLAFEQLRARLAAEGLFDPSRKRKLPLLPRRIGIVASLGGAAIHDILRVLSVRFPNAHVTIYPARAQGEGAPAEIATAVAAFSRFPGSADVLIVARGGGSKEDLAAFNDERVVRAVAASRIPTISAVGHEVDVTLTDLSADVRAATPSQAAELVVARREDFEVRLASTRKELLKILRGRLAEADGELKGQLLSTGFASFPSKISAAEADADATSAALVSTFQALPLAFSERLARTEEKLRGWPSRAAFPLLLRSTGQMAGALAERMKGVLTRASGRLTALAASLEALSPLKVLARGYSVTFREGERAPLTDAGRVAEGDPLRVVLARGELRARVTARRVPDGEG